MIKVENTVGSKSVAHGPNFLETLAILVPILWAPAVIFSLVYFSYFNIPLSISPYEAFIFLYGIILNTDLIGALIFSALVFVVWFVYQKFKRFLIRKVIRYVNRIKQKLYSWTSKRMALRKSITFLCVLKVNSKVDLSKILTPKKVEKAIETSIASSILTGISTLVVFAMNPNVVLFWQLVAMFLLVMILLPIAVLAMLVQLSISTESEATSQKKRVLSVLLCLFFSCFLIFMMSRMVIQNALTLDNQGGDFFRIWIDDRNEYLLSCNKEESYGKVMVKISILGSGINKEEVFKNDKPVQLSTVSPDRIESICKRLTKKD